MQFNTCLHQEDMATSNQASEFENYPFLTTEEFAEVCHQLDRKYCQATLGPLRRQWKLRVNQALIMAFTPLAEYSTYVQIIRPLDGEVVDDDLLAQLDSLSFGGAGDAGADSMEADQQMLDEDNDTVRSSHLLPTRLPRLWFLRLSYQNRQPNSNSLDTSHMRSISIQLTELHVFGSN